MSGKKTIRELSHTYAIPIRKLERMQKDGFLIAANIAPPGLVENIRKAFKSGNTLSAEMLRYLIRNPKEIDGLGDYEFSVSNEIAILGNVIGEAMPETAYPHNVIYGAAKREETELRQLASYIRSIIPDKGCSYHYVAVRCCLNVSDSMFPAVYPQLARAIRHARSHELLEGFSSIKGKATVFHKPKSLDL